MKILTNNSFSRIVMCLLFLSVGFAVNAQNTLVATEAQAALLETLNGDTDDDMLLMHQVVLAMNNLDQAKAEKKYSDKEYAAHSSQLQELEASIKQSSMENRMLAKKNSVVKPPKKYTDIERAIEILNQKLKEGVIDEATYQKRLKKLQKSIE